MSRVFLEVVTKAPLEAIIKLKNLLKSAGDDGKKAGDGIAGGMKKAAGQILALVGAARAAKFAIQNLLVDSVNESKFMEVAILRMVTFTKTTEEANIRMARLAKMADSTPYELPNLVTAEQRLLTYGGAALATAVNITKIGDAAALVGAPIDQLSLQVGRAYTNLKNGKPIGEVDERMRELGISIPGTLAKIEDLQKGGADFNQTWDIFISQFDRSAGSMERLAQTFEGKISTLNDKIRIFKRTVGDSGPLESLKWAITEVISEMDSLNNESNLAIDIGNLLTKSFFNTLDAIMGIHRGWIIFKGSVQEISGAILSVVGQLQIGWASIIRDTKLGTIGLTLEVGAAFQKLFDKIEPLAKFLRIDTVTDKVKDSFGNHMQDMADDISKVNEEFEQATLQAEVWAEELEKLRKEQQETNYSEFEKSTERSIKLQEKLAEILELTAEQRRKLLELRKKQLDETNLDHDIETETEAHKKLIEALEKERDAARINAEQYGQSDAKIRAYIGLLTLGSNVTAEYKKKIDDLVIAIENWNNQVEEKDLQKELNEEIDEAILKYRDLTAEIGLNEKQLFKLYLTKLKDRGATDEQIEKLRIAHDTYVDLNKEYERGSKILEEQISIMEQWGNAFVDAFVNALSGGKDALSNFAKDIGKIWQENVKNYRENPEQYGNSEFAASAFGSEGGQNAATAFSALASIYGSNEEHGRGSYEAQANGIVQGGVAGAQIGGVWGAVIGAIIGAFAGGFFEGGDWEEVGRRISVSIEDGMVVDQTLYSSQRRDGALLGLTGGTNREIQTFTPEPIQRAVSDSFDLIKQDLIDMSTLLGYDTAESLLEAYRNRIDINLENVEEGKEAEAIAIFFRKLQSQIAFNLLPIGTLLRKVGEDFADTLRRFSQLVPLANSGLELIGINIEGMLDNIMTDMLDELRNNFNNSGGIVPEDFFPDIERNKGGDEIFVLDDPDNLIDPRNPGDPTDDGFVVPGDPDRTTQEERDRYFDSLYSDEEIREAARLRFKEILIEAMGGLEEAGEKFTIIAETFHSRTDLVSKSIQDLIDKTRAELDLNLENLGIDQEDLFDIDTTGFTPEQVAEIANAQANLARLMELEREIAIVRGESIDVNNLTLDQLEALQKQTENFNNTLSNLGAEIQFTEQSLLDFASSLGQEFEQKISEFYTRFNGRESGISSFNNSLGVVDDFGISLDELISSQGSILIDKFEEAYNSGNTDLAARIVDELGPAADIILQQISVISDHFIALGISMENIDIERIVDIFGSLEDFASSINRFESMFPELNQSPEVLDEATLRDRLFEIGVNLSGNVEDVVGRMREAFVRAVENQDYETAYRILYEMAPAYREYIDGLEEERQIKLELIDLQRNINNTLSQYDGSGLVSVDDSMIKALSETMGITMVEAARLLNQSLLDMLDPAQQTALAIDGARRTLEQYNFSVEEFTTGGLQHWNNLMSAALAMGEEGAPLVAILLNIKDAVLTLVNNTDDAANEIDNAAVKLAEAFADLAKKIKGAIEGINSAISRINGFSPGAVAYNPNAISTLQSQISGPVNGLTLAQIDQQVSAIINLTGLIEERYELEVAGIHAAAQATADSINAERELEYQRRREAHEAAVLLFNEQMQHYERLQNAAEALNEYVERLSISDNGGELAIRQLENVQNLIATSMAEIRGGGGEPGELTSLLDRYLELSGIVGGTPLREQTLEEIRDLQLELNNILGETKKPTDPGELYLPPIERATAGTYVNTAQISEAQQRASIELEQLRIKLEALEEERLRLEEEERNRIETLRQEAEDRDVVQTETAVKSESHLQTIKTSNTEMESAIKNQVQVMESLAPIMVQGFSKIAHGVARLYDALERSDLRPIINVEVTVESPVQEDNGEGDLE